MTDANEGELVMTLTFERSATAPEIASRLRMFADMLDEEGVSDDEDEDDGFDNPFRIK